jgi:hypothetical protein
MAIKTGTKSAWREPGSKAWVPAARAFWDCKERQQSQAHVFPAKGLEADLIREKVLFKRMETVPGSAKQSSVSDDVIIKI